MFAFSIEDKTMKPYEKPEIEFFASDIGDILTLSTPIGVHDDPNDPDDSGYGGYGILS